MALRIGRPATFMRLEAAPDSEVDGILKRRCRRCGQWKAIATYNVSSKLKSVCRSCERERVYSAPSGHKKTGKHPGWRWREEPVLFKGSEQVQN